MIVQLHFQNRSCLNQTQLVEQHEINTEQETRTIEYEFSQWYLRAIEEHAHRMPEGWGWLVVTEESELFQGLDAEGHLRMNKESYAWAEQNAIEVEV